MRRPPGRHWQGPKGAAQPDAQRLAEEMAFLVSCVMLLGPRAVGVGLATVSAQHRVWAYLRTIRSSKPPAPTVISANAPSRYRNAISNVLNRNGDRCPGPLVTR